MIKISPTALNQFLSGCPARLAFYSQYKLKERYLPRALQFGIEVHDLVEKGLPDIEQIYDGDIMAVETAAKMLKVLEKQGYEILAQEVWHCAPLTSDIEVVGKIDIVAYTNVGVPVLVDLKTSARSWNTITQNTGEIRIPKAETFQAPMYLTPPYENPYFDGEWPQRLDYLVVPADGVTQIYPFFENAEIRANLVTACEIFKFALDSDLLPANRGWLCDNYDWQKICWDLPGWEKYYERR